MNSYQTAISSVGSVLAPYDADQLFPIFGFGGLLPSGETSHCWPLTGAEANVSVYGVQGLLDTYTNSFKYVKLSYPTIFAQVIRRVAALAKDEHQAALTNSKLRRYLILMIVTDGVITDMDDTISAIVDASAFPMSIIIIGVRLNRF